MLEEFVMAGGDWSCSEQYVIYCTSLFVNFTLDSVIEPDL